MQSGGNRDETKAVPNLLLRPDDDAIEVNIVGMVQFSREHSNSRDQELAFECLVHSRAGAGFISMYSFGCAYSAVTLVHTGSAGHLGIGQLQAVAVPLTPDAAD